MHFSLVYILAAWLPEFLGFADHFKVHAIHRGLTSGLLALLASLRSFSVYVALVRPQQGVPVAGSCIA